MAVAGFGSCATPIDAIGQGSVRHGCLRHGAGAGLGSVLATVKGTVRGMLTAMAQARDGRPSVERSDHGSWGRCGETVPGNG